MLGELDYSMNDLFMQLGLDSSDAAIEAFIASHQLEESVNLKDAPFWNEKQRMFITESWKQDAVWVHVIDELNLRLHEEQMK